MKKTYLILPGLAGLMAILPAAFPEGKTLREAVLQYRLPSLERYVPAPVLDQLYLPDAGQWEKFWNSLARAQASNSLEEMAWILPEARRALEVLESSREGIPYADWFRPRLDYLDLASYIISYLPADGSPPPSQTPLPRAPVANLVSPPAPSIKVKKEVAQERTRAASSYLLWKQRLSGRKAPARSQELVPGLKRIFSCQGVPEALVWMAEVESSFNPAAASPVGALGLYQFMPATARRFGLKIRPVDERLNPHKSARAAADYLKILKARFKTWPLALAAYNAGEGRVGRELERAGVTTFSAVASQLPAETRMYVPKVLATIYHREGLEPAHLEDD